MRAFNAFGVELPMVGFLGGGIGLRQLQGRVFGVRFPSDIPGSLGIWMPGAIVKLPPKHSKLFGYRGTGLSLATFANKRQCGERQSEVGGLTFSMKYGWRSI